MIYNIIINKTGGNTFNQRRITMSEQKLPVVPKFRAWDKETKTMNGMAEIYRNRNQEMELHPRDEEIILMQSTGLLDAFGTEIFEGDIITKDQGKTFGVVRLDWLWNKEKNWSVNLKKTKSYLKRVLEHIKEKK